MPKTKLTLSVDKHVVERAKRYSRRNDTTISALVTQFLASLGEGGTESAPVTSRLIGSLAPEGSVEEYHDYLAKKYE